MKNSIITTLILVFVATRAFTSSCNSNIDLFNYETTIENGEIKVDFYLDNSKYNIPGYTKIEYRWDFGNGDTLLKVIDPLNGTYDYESYSFDYDGLGDFSTTVSLEVTIFVDFTFTTQIQTYCYNYSEDIVHYYNVPDITADFDVETKRDKYKVNTPIGFYYFIGYIDLGYTDNLKYTLSKNSVTISTGDILSWNLYSKQSISSYTPTQSGTDYIDFTIERNGQVLYSDALSLIIEESGTSGGSGGSGGGGDCACSDERPDIDVNYSVSDDKAIVTITDISQQTFKEEYNATCVLYLIQSFSNGYANDVDTGRYTSSGFGTASDSWPIPRAFEPPRTIYYQLEVPCLKDGGLSSNKVGKTIILQPQTVNFDPTAIETKDIGVYETSTVWDIYTEQCAAVKVSANFDNVDATYSLVQYLERAGACNNNNYFGVSYASNYTEHNVNFNIKLNVQGQYAYNNIVDGEQKDYRLVMATHESKLTDISECRELIAIPYYTDSMHLNVDYYGAKLEENDDVNHSYHFYKHNQFFEHKVVGERGTTDESYVVIGGKMLKDGSFSRKSFTVNNIGCSSNFCTARADMKDINIVNVVSDAVISDYTVQSGKSINVFAGNSITLGANFSTSPGSTFTMQIKPCTMPEIRRSLCVESE